MIAVMPESAPSESSGVHATHESCSVAGVEVNSLVPQQGANTPPSSSDSPHLTPLPTGALSVVPGTQVSPVTVDPHHSEVVFSGSSSHIQPPSETQFHSPCQGRRSKHRDQRRTNTSPEIAHPSHRDLPPHQTKSSNVPHGGYSDTSTKVTKTSSKNSTSGGGSSESRHGHTAISSSHPPSFQWARPRRTTGKSDHNSDSTPRWGTTKKFSTIARGDRGWTDTAGAVSWGTTENLSGWGGQPSIGTRGSFSPGRNSGEGWGTSTGWGVEESTGAGWYSVLEPSVPDEPTGVPPALGAGRSAVSNLSALAKSTGQALDSVPATTTSSCVPMAPSLPTTRAMLDSLLLPLIHESSPISLMSSCDWRAIYIDRGILVVKPHDEVRLRYRALLNPSWGFREFITDAISRGIRFLIAIKRQDLRVFDLPMEQLPARPECYKPGFRDRLLVYQSGARFFDIWEQEVRVILERPHAYIYLFYGGLLWRIAREFGPPHLFQAVAAGPSIAATAWGQYDEIQGPLLITEAASKYELAILLGEAQETSKSLWPSLIHFHNLPFWSGEWNPAAELWFLRRLSAIRAGAEPRSDEDWERDGRNDDTLSPDLDSAFTLFTNSSSGSWNKKAICDILLSEQMQCITL